MQFFLTVTPKEEINLETKMKEKFSRDAQNIFYLIKNSNSTLKSSPYIRRDSRKIYFCWTNRRCHPPDCRTMSRVYWVNLIYMFQSRPREAMNMFFARSRGRKKRKWKIISTKLWTIARNQGEKGKMKGKIEREKKKLNKKFIRHWNLFKSQIKV